MTTTTATTTIKAALRLVALSLAAIAAGGSACHSEREMPGYVEAVGDPQRGEELIRENGCGACHAIAGVHGARGVVGPPLDNIAKRSFLAGELPMTAQNIERWIMHPTQIEPHTAMPDLGLDERDARDVAAFLLREE